MKALENRTILVTGAGGFIGSHLVERLVMVKGVRLLLLSRRSRSSRLPQAIWLRGSLNDLTRGYWEKLGISHINVIFHLGAFIPKVTGDINNIEHTFIDNLQGTRTLLEGLPTGIDSIVFSSTVDVYAPTPSGVSLTEGSPLGPVGLYGASKLFCEKLVSVWSEKNGRRYAILRYGHIFGPGEESYGKLIPLMIRRLLAGKVPNVYGSGMAERDFLYVKDAVEATVRAACSKESIGPVNIVRGASTSIGEIAELLIEKTGAQVQINFLTDKPDGRSLRFDNAMMRRTLGDWPLVSLSDGLEEEVSAFRRLVDVG